MIPLTEGAIDKIMNGVDVDKPVLQILGHKKLASSSSGERYRLLVSDGKRINSFTMLATQLNSMVTDNLLTEFSICQINRYAISMVNSSGKQKRVMVILNLDVKVPGVEVGSKIGNPLNVDNSETEHEMKPTQAAPAVPASVQKQTGSAARRANTGHSLISPDVSTTPIAALSPYQNRWVIKARVTSKSPIKTWSNSRGEGKLFSMDLVDESSEIRCTGFRDLCDKFYDIIEVGSIYFISRCTLKPANKQFNYLKNDYEMTLTNDTEIIPCHDDTSEIPTIQFDFSPISVVEKKEKNGIIDILAITKSCGELQTIVSRATGRELKKKDVNLVDESNTMVCLTLWGTHAEEFDGSSNPVLAIKGARIGEFNGGKNLSTLSSTVLQIDPDIPEAHKLRGWYNSVGRMEETKSISRPGTGGGSLNGPWLTFKDSMAMELGRFNTDVFITKATVNLIKLENAVYKSCPSEGCKKKLVDQENGMYTCEKCGRDYPTFNYRLLANAHLADWTDNIWATAFSEDAEKLLGMKAQDLGELMSANNDAYMEKFAQAAFKDYIFKLRAKAEVFNDDDRIRYTLMAATPIDYNLYNDYLLGKIKELVGIEKA